MSTSDDGKVLPGDEPLADALLAAMGSLRRVVRRSAGTGWPLAVFTGSQAELVRLLRRRPGLSVAEAAAELNLAANSVSTIVGQLVAAGVITRTPSPSDRRVARLRLTEQARERLEDWRDRRVNVVATAITRLDRADRDRLAEALPVLARLTAGAADLAAGPPPAAEADAAGDGGIDTGAPQRGGGGEPG